jgi:uncharacterized protein YndB with AHSA1/START domain
MFFEAVKTKINTMKNNSVKLLRVIKTKPEKVYKAFTDPLAIASWLPPYGFLCTVHQMDARVGGTYKMSFTNFSTGHSDSFSGKYHEVKPNEFLKYTDKFDNPDFPGEITTTVSFRKVSSGTEMEVFQEGIPEAMPADMCYLGWQDSLEKLIKLVEPEIPDSM